MATFALEAVNAFRQRIHVHVRRVEMGVGVCWQGCGDVARRAAEVGVRLSNSAARAAVLQCIRMGTTAHSVGRMQAGHPPRHDW